MSTATSKQMLKETEKVKRKTVTSGSISYHNILEQIRLKQYMINMVNVDLWDITVHCLKCNNENKATLLQLKRGETIHCNVCGTSIGLKDKDGTIEKEIMKTQEAVNSLELAVQKIGVTIQA
jgi:DNA-directed RNA polymerase subunit RPC12/RpoP